MSSTSRYSGLDVVEPSELNARRELSPRRLLDPVELERDGLLFEHTVTQGERIDTLAYHLLGDARLWYAIADVNPDVDPLFLPPGAVIKIPRIEALR